jgi:hypothetical protein
MSYLEVLSDARVSLLWKDRRVLDPRVPSRRHVPNDRLLAGAIRVVVTVWACLVVALVSVVLVGVALSIARIIARGVGSVSRRVGRGCVGGSTLYAGLVLCRVGRRTTNGSESTKAI